MEHLSRHKVTRELSAPGRPFSALGSSRLAIAYLNTWVSITPPPPTWWAHTLTTLFFKFCWVQFFLVTRPIFICCIYGPCFSGSCLDWARIVFFFRLKSSNCFPVKTHVFGRPFFFCTFCLWSWGFEFAPACGSPASVSDHVMASQGYIEVEQVRTWLLSSSLAKFQQF